MNSMNTPSFHVMEEFTHENGIKNEREDLYNLSQFYTIC